jgi:serine/threonine protein kinase
MRKKSQSQSLIEEEIAYILSEVTNALVYLHGHCRIHRDIKGNNILLTEEGKMILMWYIMDLYAQKSTRDYSLVKRLSPIGILKAISKDSVTFEALYIFILYPFCLSFVYNFFTKVTLS